MAWINRPRAPLPIRSSLAMLVAACVLPGALISAYFIADNYRLHKDHLVQNAIASARSLASAMDRDLASVESGLRVLAVSPALASNDLAAFYQSAKEVLPYQNISNYVLLDRLGQQQLNTLRPFGSPLPSVGGPPALQRIFDTDAPVLTDLFVGPVTGKPILAMGVPVHRKGQTVLSLNVGIFPERVAALMTQQQLPQPWICAILDGTGKIIARSRDMDRFVGKPAVPALVRLALSHREGTLETTTLEGIDVITAFSRSSVSPWTVAVGVPKSEITADLRRSLGTFLAANVLLFSLGAWIAWRFALSHVVVPADRLRDRMNELSAGGVPGLRAAQGMSLEFLALEQGLEDMAQRLRDREQERESMINRLTATLESISDGFYLLDHQWRFAYVNQQAQHMLGLSSTAMIGRDHWQALPVPELLALRAEYAEAMSSGRAITLHVNVPSRALELEVHLYPSEYGLSVYCRDVTELHQVQAAQQAQHAAEAANQAKNEFLSRVSHELRTPLNAVIGFAQVLQKDPQAHLSERQRSMIERIEMSGQHLLDMIKDILVHEIVQDCHDMLAPQAAQAQVIVIVSEQSLDLCVRADGTRLKQVLLNLLNNAIKYNRPGGRIELDISRHERRVFFRIQDDGIGMSEQQLTHLFEPFNRLGQELGATPGTGIGLLISRKLISLMGGHLQVTSRVGLGSTFAFELPEGLPPHLSSLQCDAQPAGRAPPTSGTTESYGPRSVLYVEDNQANCEIMGAILAFRPQIDVSFASGVRNAQDRLQAESFDLILLDMQLPDGSGLQVLKWLRAQTDRRHIPVMVISADATEETMSQAMAAGACNYLRKPVDVRNTLNKVDTVLSQTETA